MNNDKKPTSYYIGQFFAVIVALCVMAIIVTLTAKLIFWII